MKILFAVSVFDIGGAEVLALELAKKLHEQGHEIIIYVANEKVVNKDLVAKYAPYIKSIYSLADRPTLRLLATKLNSLFRRLGFADELIKKVRGQYLRSVIKLEKVDLICSHSPRSDIVCGEAAKNLRIPLIMVEHGIYSFYLHTGRAQLLKPLHAATEIIAVSEFCKKQIKRYAGAAANVTTIYNGVHVKQQHSRDVVRKELGIHDNEIVFGLVARGERRKGWEHAIDAFLKLKQASDKKIHLVLVGGSDYVEGLKQRYTSCKQIHFIGKVANPAYYTDAVDVGLMLSMYRTESLSLSAIEFLMLGKPIIATNVGGVPEVLQFNENSLCKLINPQEDGSIDTEKLKDLMLYFTEREKKLALDPAQMEFVLTRFSMQKCVQAYEKFFQRILSKDSESYLGVDATKVKELLRGKQATHSQFG